MLTVLHLSDLHFGSDHHWGRLGRPDLADAISRGFDEDGAKPFDLVILSGDLTSKGSENYLIVDSFLRKLLQHPRIKNVRDILCVPGNHDFPFEVDGQKILEKKKREDYYRTFLKNYLSVLKKDCKIKVDRLTWIDNNIKMKMHEHLLNLSCMIRKHDNSDDLLCFLFFALNSMVVDSEENAGIGFFGLEQLELVKKIVKSCSDHYQDHDVIPLAICHHHLVPVSFVAEYFEQTPHRSSVTLDARYALEVLKEIGCPLVFHGHMHQPSCVSWRDRMGENQHTINIVGAGSAGGKKDDLGDIRHHQFFVHTISKNSIIAKSYTTSNVPIRFTFDERYSTSLTWPPFGSKIKDECVKAHIEPKGSRKIARGTANDNSNLYFMFLNVINCKETRKIIKDFAIRDGKVQICAMYDLYGRYDTVVKYRDSLPREKRFYSELWNHLNSHPINQIRQETSPHTIDVSDERYNLFDITRATPLIILPDNNVYEEALWTCAFIEILLAVKMEINEFLAQLIFRLKTEFDGKLFDIIKGAYLGHDRSVLLELKMSCNQFHYMNKLSTAIESIIDKKGIDKYSHIAYSHQEISA